MSYRKISNYKLFVRRLIAACIPDATLRERMRSKWLRDYNQEGNNETKSFKSVQNSVLFRNETGLVKILLDSCSYSSKRILLVSHESGLSGAPMALFHMAVMLKKMGFYPVYFSLKEGEMRFLLEKESIPFIVNDQIDSQIALGGDELRAMVKLFDIVVYNTLETRKIAIFLGEWERSPRKFMWIHECELYYSGWTQEEKEKAVAELAVLDHILCAGNYAQRMFSQYFPQFKWENLLYGLPDNSRKGGESVFLKKGLVTFGILGTWEERKNQLGFIKAVSLLPEHQRKKARFVVLGNSLLHPDYALKIRNEAAHYPEVVLLSELPHDEFLKEMEKMDVVVSFSTDDPMPVVLAEAFMNSKTVVTTDRTGTASFIKSGVNGFVVSAEDNRHLSDVMKKLIEDKDLVKEAGKEGRKIYDDFFSFDVFEKSLFQLFQNEAKK